MKKIYKVLIGIFAIAVMAVSGTYVYIKLFLPNTGKPPAITIQSSAERIERGRYLANNVTVCMDCHSTRDWSQFAGPLSGNLGGGGEKFGKEMGFPGNIYARNITPFNLGNWTDGELFRAITTGVNKDGKALFPLMPYLHYGQMDKEDIYSIIAYIRTLDPIKNQTLKRELDFPVSLLVNTMPQKASPQQKPDPANKLAYGAYLVNASGCVDCHSKTENGSIVKGTEFGGGMEFVQPAGIARSANLTTDKKTGIGLWTKEMFVQRFKAYDDSTYRSPKLTPSDLNTPMPWRMYAGMKRDDLEAIYTYLHSLQPISNAVKHFEKK